MAIKTLEWYPSRWAALDAETKAIAADNPVHNKKRPPAEEMTMRSWYMPQSSADQLAALADDLHFATRLPKQLIIGTLADMACQYRDEIEAEARAVGGKAG